MDPHALASSLEWLRVPTSVRAAALTLLSAFVLLPAVDARAQREGLTDRGIYASALLTGAEPEGPKPTADTDLDLFTGYGLAGAVGYRWLPLRLELEYQSNTAYKLDAFLFGGGGDDRIAVRSLMLNGFIEGQVNQWFGVFAGAGFGRAKVKVDLVTCLQLAGCPTFAESHTSGSASARQIQLGVTVGPFSGHQVVIGFRRLKTGALGLTDTAAQPFAVDRADLKMSFVGWRGNF